MDWASWAEHFHNAVFCVAPGGKVFTHAITASGSIFAHSRATIPMVSFRQRPCISKAFSAAFCGSIPTQLPMIRWMAWLRSKLTGKLCAHPSAEGASVFAQTSTTPRRAFLRRTEPGVACAAARAACTSVPAQRASRRFRIVVFTSKFEYPLKSFANAGKSPGSTESTIVLKAADRSEIGFLRAACIAAGISARDRRLGRESTFPSSVFSGFD